MRELQWTKWGNLDCVISHPKNPNTKGPCIVFFHGYGADAQDLAGLTPYLKVPDSATLMFPNGPLKVPIGAGFDGRAWCHINIRDFEESLSQGKVRDLSGSRPEGMTQVRDQVKGLVEELYSKHSQVFLGGFSQGSMLAVELALFMKQKPNGIIILSGNLVDAKSWQQWAPTAKGVPFFMSHGTNDAILGFPGAEALEQMLTKAGLEGQMMSFRGGHEIPPKIIESMNSFLRHHVK